MLATSACLITLGCSGSGRSVSPIRLEPLVTLGDAGGEGGIANTPQVSALHPAGFRVVLQARNAIGAPPLVFSDAGSFVGSLRGDTSHTQSNAAFLFTRFGPGDSIWIFDSDMRAQLFDGQLRFGRQFLLPDVASDALVLGDGRLVVAAAHGGLRLLTAQGRVEHVLRAAGPSVSATLLLFSGDAATFWTATTTGPLILDHWDTTGKRIASRPMEVSWLAANPAGPTPSVTAAWIDSTQRLWLVGAIADRNSERGMDAEGSIRDFDKYYDTVIEVRELTTGRLLASAVFDKAFRSGAGPGFVASEVHASGWLKVEIHRIMLDQVSPRH